MYEEYNKVFLYGDVTYKTGEGDTNVLKASSSLSWDESNVGVYDEGSYDYEAIGPGGVTYNVRNSGDVVPYNRILTWFPIFSSATYDSVTKGLTLKTGEVDIKIDTPKITAVSSDGGNVGPKAGDDGETKAVSRNNYLALPFDYIFWKSHFGDYFFNAQIPPTMHNIRHILRIYGLDDKYGGSNNETYLYDDVVYDTTQNTCVLIESSNINSANIRPAVINVDCNLASDFGFTQESDGSYTSSKDDCFVNIKPINDDMVQVKIATVNFSYSSEENFIISDLTNALPIYDGYYNTDGVYTIFATVPPYMHNILHMMKMCGWYGSYSVGGGGGEKIAV